MIKIIDRDTKQTKLKDDECIVIYKCGSRGEIIDIKYSIMSIVDEERMLNKRFQAAYVGNVLNGYTKSYASFNHRCRVRPIIKKISEVKHLING